MLYGFHYHVFFMKNYSLLLVLKVSLIIFIVLLERIVITYYRKIIYLTNY